MATTTLSIVLPAMNEADNLVRLIPQLWSVVDRLKCDAEIIVVAGSSTDGTVTVARDLGAVAIEQTSKGYGGALAEGFAAASGEWILTMDADLSHPPIVLATMWAARESADMLIASRYARGGRAVMPLSRRVLSRVLNLSFPYLLSLPIRDMSSGFRLYRRNVIADVPVTGRNFDALQGLLMHAYGNGYRVREIPFAYQPRGAGQSKASVLRFATSYLRTLFTMYTARNSDAVADAEARAYQSANLARRWWQRWRHYIVLSMAQNYLGTEMLHVGCGSSRIFFDLSGAIGIDENPSKVRYMKSHSTNPVLFGNTHELPFSDARFDCVISTNVLEKTVHGEATLDEMLRVLRPEGLLILGTPDYSRRVWRLVERVYDRFFTHGFARSRVSHYTQDSLITELARRGWICTDMRYVFGSEMIGAFQREAVPVTPLVPLITGRGVRESLYA